MKYTYKDECIIHDKGDVVHFILLGVWICATLAVFLIDAYLILVKGSEGNGSLVVGGLFFVVVVVIGISVYRDISKRRNRALEVRRKAMEEGKRYDGTIIASGKGKESVEYEWRNDDDTTETRYMTEPNYWIVVEYVTPEDGAVKRFRALHMHKNMRRFIGCGVDVYVWHEWSPYIQKELTLTYIDTCGLK